MIGGNALKIATYNVNSVNGRLPRFPDWLADTKPDVVCVQELKTDYAKFSVRAIEDAAYGAVRHGQRSHHGVAIFAKAETPMKFDVGYQALVDAVRFLSIRVRDSLPLHVTCFRSLMKKYHSTILVVDDDPNDLFFIEKAFRAIGVKDPIHLIGGGQEAIDYVMGKGKFSDRSVYIYPTFIMTDLKMPGIDGFAVLEHLKNNPEWAVIPTVVLSASSDLDDIKKAYMLGASSYHVKPHSIDDLRQLLKVLHDYWMTCEVPKVDWTGRQLHTDSKGKLGERFPQP